MKVTENLEGKVLTAALEGRLDTATAPELEAALKDKLETVDALVLDLTDLEYISSAGLRTLLSFHKTMSRKGGMKVIHPQPMVMEVFEITGFSDVFTIEA